MNTVPRPPEALFARMIAFVAILFCIDVLLLVFHAQGYDARAALAAACGFAVLTAEIAERLLKA
ncbi:hypothetical protein [Dactylosporangium sp. CA-092794]|uniref:hypothetical protein n=1 Tax=Dactylosporangium sp. CA-092794 TaxID=3239929 RepID=UPI003D8E3F09